MVSIINPSTWWNSTFIDQTLFVQTTRNHAAQLYSYSIPCNVSSVQNLNRNLIKLITIDNSPITPYKWTWYLCRYNHKIYLYKIWYSKKNYLKNKNKSLFLIVIQLNFIKFRLSYRTMKNNYSPKWLRLSLQLPLRNWLLRYIISTLLFLYPLRDLKHDTIIIINN